MNLFIMDALDIIKYYKPQTEVENYLVESLRDCHTDLHAIQEVLGDYSLTYDNVSYLDKELKEAFDHILVLEDENETLESENNLLLQESEDYCTEIEALKEEIEELKKVNENWESVFHTLKGE